MQSVSVLELILRVFVFRPLTAINYGFFTFQWILARKEIDLQ
jgi:hypothetical protein